VTLDTLATVGDGLSLHLFGTVIDGPLTALSLVGVLGMATWVCCLGELELGARTRHESYVTSLLEESSGKGRLALALLQCWAVPPTVAALLV
jgi:hypothetical protein